MIGFWPVFNVVHFPRALDVEVKDLISGTFKQIDEKVCADSGSLRAKHLDIILHHPNPKARKYYLLKEDPAPQVLYLLKSTKSFSGRCHLHL